MKFTFENHAEIDFEDTTIEYFKEKIAHNMAYKTVQPNKFDRRKYKFMIMKIITMRMKGKSYKEIGDVIGRSSERVRQQTYRFFNRLKFCVEHNNQPILRSLNENKTK